MKKKNIIKLLDLWSPPLDSGEPIGCLATTYTFDSEFFEEECLGRFVKMESDPFSDGPFYLIEREEKFSGIKAAVLVDKSHCRGKRSLRWDLIPFRNRSLLHAKITFLFWSNHIRIIIGSANITKSGYRINQEISGSLDFNKGSDIPTLILEQIINFLRSLATNSGNSPAQAEIQKWNAVLDQAWERRGFYTSSVDYSDYKNLRIYPLFIIPGKENLFELLTDIWKKCTGHPSRKAYITSPFFDENTPNKPAHKIWDVLAQRGEASVRYNLVVNNFNPESNSFSVNAPESINYKPASRSQLNIEFHQIREEDTIGDKTFTRPVHQKSIWLEEEDWNLYLIGSSNFTSAGTGLSSKSNFEANLAYIISSSRNKKVYSQLIKSYPETQSIKKIGQWKQIPNDDEASGDDVSILPPGFMTAYFDLIKDRSYLLLTFNVALVPEGFKIFDEKDKLLLNHVQWIQKGKKSEVDLLWTEQYLPSELKVTWIGGKSPAWWPINVISQASLPVPEQLKELQLDLLLRILASTRPLYQSARRNLKINENGSLEILPEIDPLKRVDTSEFLLQRTRRISYALNALKNKLERPVFTLESLQWRLSGPIGVSALCDAILKGSKSEEETVFLLTEIAFELSEITPIEVENSLKTDIIKSEIRKMINEIHLKAKKISKRLKVKSIDWYYRETLKKIR